MQNSKIRILEPHFQRFSFPVDSDRHTGLGATELFIVDALQIVLKGLGFLRGSSNQWNSVL